MQSKKIRVRFLSTMKHAVGQDEKTVEVSDEATVADLLRLISVAYSGHISGFLFEGNNGRTRNDVLILVNDTDIDALDGVNTALFDNDEVVLMPISHGG